MDFDDLDDDMPGGDDFVDVTNVFEEAARDMEHGQLLFTDGFTRLDAMSAIEIGEPRMDSGVILEGTQMPEFEPLTPLLPQEICWILDRILACEIQWYAGSALSQTVFTLLYVHHLEDIDPEYVYDTRMFDDSPDRPIELITVVLRSAVSGLLKCCDLAWRELSKSRVQEGEDWQGEKCEVSLLEGFTAKNIIKRLEQASLWVRSTSKVPINLQDDLLSRILFRKTLLEMTTVDLLDDHTKLEDLLSLARELLNRFRSQIAYIPPPDSPAHLAFNPYVTRHLHSFMPLRPMQLPPQEKVWEALEAYIDGWQELYYLSSVTAMSTWKILGCIRMQSAQPLHAIPYLRSLAQSFFYDGSRFLGRFENAWIVERFFYESMGIPYHTISKILHDRWHGSGTIPVKDIERLIMKIMVGHIRSFWYNAPRQRRFLSKSLLDWHVLYATVLSLASDSQGVDEQETRIINGLPKVVLSWRLSIIWEIVLSGFQLDLYSPDEETMAYWYASHVIEAHLDCLDSLISIAPAETAAHAELDFQHAFLTALQAMCMGMAMMTRGELHFPQERTKLNFLRRYKWAFRPEYDEVSIEPVAPPDFSRYMSWHSQRQACTSSEMFQQAGQILVQLSELPSSGWGARWQEDRIRFVDSLRGVCLQMLEQPSAARPFDVSTRMNPWFPRALSRSQPPR